MTRYARPANAAHEGAKWISLPAGSYAGSAVCKRWRALAEDGTFTRVVTAGSTVNEVIATARPGDTIFIQAGFYSVRA